MIKCGIIGYGKMGRIRAKAIEESKRGRVVCVFDCITPDDCPYEVTATDSSVIEHSEVDAVFVCTPNYRIEPLVIEALQTGKHVFSEKPPAFNAAGVERIRKAEIEAQGKKLMYGFNHRHHGSIWRMKEIIDSGEMGKVLWMRGRYGKEVDESFFEGWRAKKELAGGGIMLDQGIHMLDLFLYLGGGFDEVHAFVSNLFWHIEGVEDNCFAIFRNSETGVCASLHSTMTQWRYLFSLEVFLEGGALILNGLKTSSGAYGDEDLAIKRNTQHVEQGKFDSEEHIVFHTDTSWASEISQFFDCIENDQPVGLGSSRDALELMKIMDRIYGGKLKG
jgi:1,5-anhydro-D-fructose reductase (1,5-anhydro-D-mannitol-forming)